MTFAQMLYNLMRDWHPLGQFLFLCVAGMTVVGAVLILANNAVVLVRGWPPAGTPGGPELVKPGAADADRVAHPPARS